MISQLAALLVASGSFYLAQAAEYNKWECQQTDSYPYCTHVQSQNAPDGGAWPIMCFLPGSGARGSLDQASSLAGYDGHGKLVSEYLGGNTDKVHSQAAEQFLTVVPIQADGTRHFDPDNVASIIAEVQSNFNVDPNRIYISGYSMGARGTHRSLTFHPEIWAAGAPSAGAAEDSNADTLQQEAAPQTFNKLKAEVSIPVWSFAGQNDNTAGVDGSESTEEEVESLGGNEYKLTVVPGADHPAMNSKPWTDYDLLSWFLQQSKSGGSTASGAASASGSGSEATATASGSAVPTSAAPPVATSAAGSGSSDDTGDEDEDEDCDEDEDEDDDEDCDDDDEDEDEDEDCDDDEDEDEDEDCDDDAEDESSSQQQQPSGSGQATGSGQSDSNYGSPSGSGQATGSGQSDSNYGTPSGSGQASGSGSSSSSGSSSAAAAPEASSASGSGQATGSGQSDSNYGTPSGSGQASGSGQSDSNYGTPSGSGQASGSGQSDSNYGTPSGSGQASGSGTSSASGSSASGSASGEDCDNSRMARLRRRAAEGEAPHLLERQAHHHVFSHSKRNWEVPLDTSMQHLAARQATTQDKAHRQALARRSSAATHGHSHSSFGRRSGHHGMSRVVRR